MITSIVLFITTIILAIFAYGLMAGVASTSLALGTWVSFAAFTLSVMLMGWERPVRR